MKAKRNLGKRSLKDICKKRCKGRILAGGKYCDCIEDKLPTLQKTRSASLVYVPAIEIYGENLVKGPESESSDEIEKRLKEIGLEVYEVQLVMMRYVEGKTMREIATELEWISHSSVNYHLRRALKKLKERNYGRT